MDTKILVEELYLEGKKLIEVLDKLGKVYPIYLWTKFPEKEDWVLIIGVSGINKDGANNFFHELHNVIISNKIELSLSQISIMDTSSEFIRTLKMMVKVEGVSRVSFIDNIINGKKFPNSLIYRAI
jgi:hypothetical protein